MIVGLVGCMGCGKEAVGTIFQQHGFARESFSAPLKDACAAIFGWPRELLDGESKASREWRELPDPFWSSYMEYPFTPRLALQRLGTEAGRNVFHSNIWVMSLLKRSLNKNVVVTDVRFRNEIEGIKRQGGIIIRVKRGTDPLWYDDALAASNGDEAAFARMRNVHRSEWDWVGAGIDHEIENDGSLEDLDKTVSALIASVFQSPQEHRR